MNYDHFTSRAKLAVQNAMGKAVDLSHQQVTPTHLLFGLCNDESGVINKVFGLLEANIEDFKKKIIEVVAFRNGAVSFDKFLLPHLPQRGQNQAKV